MRSGRIFWGLVIFLVGFALLLEPLGIIPAGFNVWRFLLPGFVILLGIWFLVAPAIHKGRKLETESLVIPLEGASEARLKLKHGAGRLNLTALDSADTFLKGEFGGGVEQIKQRDGAAMNVKLRTPSFQFDFGPQFEGLNWDIRLNRNIPIRLDVDSGACESELDLRELKITELNIETGASSTRVNLPENAGTTYVQIESGAAAMVIRVPDQVAARIRVESGLAGITINQTRFPRIGNGYETPGYAGSLNKAEIFVKTGVGSLEII